MCKQKVRKRGVVRATSACGFELLVKNERRLLKFILYIFLLLITIRMAQILQVNFLEITNNGRLTPVAVRVLTFC